MTVTNKMKQQTTSHSQYNSYDLQTLIVEATAQNIAA